MKAQTYKRGISSALVSFRDVKDDLVRGGARVASPGYVVTMVQFITGHHSTSQDITGHHRTSQDIR